MSFLLFIKRGKKSTKQNKTKKTHTTNGNRISQSDLYYGNMCILTGFSSASCSTIRRALTSSSSSKDSISGIAPTGQKRERARTHIHTQKGKIAKRKPNTTFCPPKKQNKNNYRYFAHNRHFFSLCYLKNKNNYFAHNMHFFLFFSFFLYVPRK